MKLKHFITGTLLTMSLLLLNTGNGFAATSTGHLDGVSGDTISGWAWDSENPNNSLEVTVTVTLSGSDTPVKEILVPANNYRDDLQSAGRGNGNYGFQAVVYWDQLQAGTYIIQASYNGKAFPNSLVYNSESKTTSQTAGSGSANIVRSLGIFRTTAYCPCRSCSEGWGRQTSTGAVATANHTVAVDTRVIPYGTKLMINGVIYTAEDRGGGVKGKHIDIYFNSHAETYQYGSRNAEVFLVQ